MGAGLLIHALLFDFDGLIVDSEAATFHNADLVLSSLAYESLDAIFRRIDEAR